MSFESKINFNGKEYSSLNDIPDEFKVMFKDENRNGIPDFVEGLLNTSQGSSVKPLVANFNSFFYNGRQYSSIDQMPPEAKEMVNKGLAKPSPRSAPLQRPPPPETGSGNTGNRPAGGRTPTPGHRSALQPPTPAACGPPRRPG